MRGLIVLLGGVGVIAVGLLVDVGSWRWVLLASGAILSGVAFGYAVSRGRRQTRARHVLLGVVAGCSTLLGTCAALFVGFVGTHGCIGDAGISYTVVNGLNRPLTLSASGLRKDVPARGSVATADLAPCGRDPGPFDKPSYVIAAFDGGVVVYCHAFSYNDIVGRGGSLRVDREEDSCTPEQRPR